MSTLTALSWDGDLPRLGEYLMAARGRTAYLIIGIKRPKQPCAHVAKFTVDKIPRGALQPDAVIHGWVWSKR